MVGNRSKNFLTVEVYQELLSWGANGDISSPVDVIRLVGEGLCLTLMQRGVFHIRSHVCAFVEGVATDVPLEAYQVSAMFAAAAVSIRWMQAVATRSLMIADDLSGSLLVVEPALVIGESTPVLRGDATSKSLRHWTSSAR